MAKKKKPKCADDIGVIYARYSSHRQKDVSIEQQIRACKTHAADMEIRLIDTYEDRAVSGRTDKRPGFQRMMRDAENGLFRYVIAWKSNRIGRNMLEAMMNEARLQECGVKVLYVEEDFDDSAAGRFALRTMMNVNQFYSENMAEDIRRGIRDNALNCKVTNGSLPFGYRVSPDKHWELDPPKDAYVREIFERVARGDALIDIARNFNARGIRTTRGKEWAKASFGRLLHNERYTGVYIYDDVRIEGGVPRIVSDELFWKVQEVMKHKKNPRGNRHRAASIQYLLTGKLRCGHCGSLMTGLSGTSKTGVLHHYYVCQKKRTEHACDKKNVRRDSIEIAVARAIQTHVLTDEVIEWIADSTVAHYDKRIEQSHLRELEAQYKDTQKRLKNLLNTIETGGGSKTTMGRVRELEQEEADLLHQVAAARAEIIDIDRETIIEGLNMYKGGDILDPEYREELFNTFLIAVYVYDDTLKLVFSFTGDKNNIVIPFELESPPEGSPSGSVEKVRLPIKYGSPSTDKRTQSVIFMLDELFILVCPLETAAK